MKTISFPLARIVGSICVLAIFISPALNASGPDPEPIPWTEIGSRAEAQYGGDGLAIVPGEDGVVIHSIFQRLRGEATPEGLWLESTVEGAEAERFRVRATAVGRSRFNVQGLELEPGEHPTTNAQLAKFNESEAVGFIETDGKLVRFNRPGLIEEYSTSMDGVRQDFLVLERPAGEGELRVELEVEGARAEVAAFGARLVLENSGRQIAYSRLYVEDAEGRVLPARFAVAAADRLAILVADAGAVYPVRIDPTFSDENWISMGGLPGANGDIYAAVVSSDGTLFVGGVFTAIGDVPANRVARWNGNSWSTLGSGMDNTVHALAVSGGDLYAGGGFTWADGVRVNGIARWNGSSWSALDLGVRGTVYALAVSGNDLYAGGAFSTAGSRVSANRIARWDGSSWSALGSGVNGTVYALAVSEGNLYAGGSFTTADGGNADRIARWDGSSWQALGSGVNGTVYALAVSGSHVYAGGYFWAAGEVRVNNIARWDGRSWLALDSGVSGRVEALVVFGGDLYAGGSFPWAGGGSANRVARWDGVSWSALGSGMSSWVIALAVSGDDLYAGGWFTTVGGVSANRIARWDGTSWSALGSGMNSGVNALAFSGGDLYAGGWFTRIGVVSMNHIARWDGSSWSALGSGVNGRVEALAVFGGDLYVAGLFTTAGGVDANRIARWDGSSWSALGCGLNDWVSALVVSGDDLYAGGWFTTAGGVSTNYVARWDGSSWSALGSGMNARVNALAVSGGDLYAGGWFTTAGGVSTNYVARWDGSSWSALGSGLNGRVEALAVFGGNVYAGGEFRMAGGVSASNIARWDGSSWTALGSGVNDRVSVLAVSAGDLYAGGVFTIAGGKVSAFVTKTDIAVSLSNGTVVEQRRPGALVGVFGAIEIGEGGGQTVFTLVSGLGDDDNDSFSIDGNRLTTAGVLDYHVQNLFTIRVRATYEDGSRAEKVFLLRVDRDGFLVWADALPPGQRGEMDDPGALGIPNLLRYAFGMDPQAPDQAGLPRQRLVETTVEGKPRIHLTLTYDRRADDPDLVFMPEGSEDLATWTPLVDAETVDGSNATTETVTVTDPEPVDGRSNGFLRVRVGRNE